MKENDEKNLGRENAGGWVGGLVVWQAFGSVHTVPVLAYAG